MIQSYLLNEHFMGIRTPGGSGNYTAKNAWRRATLSPSENRWVGEVASSTKNSNAFLRFTSTISNSQDLRKTLQKHGIYLKPKSRLAKQVRSIPTWDASTEAIHVKSKCPRSQRETYRKMEALLSKAHLQPPVIQQNS